MSATGSWVAQKAIVATIRASAAIMALIENVYDQVPQSARFPYVVVGDGEETDASSFGQVGHDVTPFIDVYTRDGELANTDTGAAGFKVGESIADLIVTALLADGFSVSGHDVCVFPLGAFDKDRNPDDPSIRRVSVKIRMLLEDTPVSP